MTGEMTISKPELDSVSTSTSDKCGADYAIIQVHVHLSNHYKTQRSNTLDACSKINSGLVMTKHVSSNESHGFDKLHIYALKGSSSLTLLNTELV